MSFEFISQNDRKFKVDLNIKSVRHFFFFFFFVVASCISFNDLYEVLYLKYHKTHTHIHAKKQNKPWPPPPLLPVPFFDLTHTQFFQMYPVKQPLQDIHPHTPLSKNTTAVHHHVYTRELIRKVEYIILNWVLEATVNQKLIYTFKVIL